MRERLKRIVPIVFASVLIPLILCIEAPIEIFSSNYEEFLFSLKDFLPTLILTAVCITLLIGIVLFTLPKKLYHIFYMLTVATALLLFLQENYLNIGVNTLAGDNLGGEIAGTGASVINLVIWIAVEAGAVTAACFWNKTDIISLVALMLSVVILGTQIIGGTTVFITNENIFMTKLQYNVQSNPDYDKRYVSAAELNNISTDTNIFYFCIDRFDELYAEDAFARRPELFENLDGFTWFRDDISNYSHTFPAVPKMLTGVDYDCASSRTDYLDSCYMKADTPISVLAENGYDINIFTAPYYAYSSEFYFPDFVTNIKNDGEPEPMTNIAKVKLSLRLIEMSLYRCVFNFAKGFFGNINSTVCNSYITENADVYDMNNKFVYDYVENNEFKLIDEKQLSFIHINGCHEVDYDENWQPLPEDDENPDVTVSVANSLKIVNLYLDELKAEGLYDNATVIITGDHASALDDIGTVVGARRTALFFKPSGSSGDALRASDKQVTHDNIWHTVFDSVGIEYSLTDDESLFNVPDGDRVRHYVFHAYTPGCAPTDRYEFEICGNGADFDNWKTVDVSRYDRYLYD